MTGPVDNYNSTVVLSIITGAVANTSGLQLTPISFGIIDMLFYFHYYSPNTISTNNEATAVVWYI